MHKPAAFALAATGVLVCGGLIFANYQSLPPRESYPATLNDPTTLANQLIAQVNAKGDGTTAQDVNCIPTSAERTFVCLLDMTRSSGVTSISATFVVSEDGQSFIRQ